MEKLFVLVLALGTLAWAGPEEGCKQTDPSKVIMVINRDSSDLSFIDTDTETVCGRVSIGDWQNPHMAMFRPKGDRIVVSGTMRNQIHVIEFPSLKVLGSIDTGNEPEHLDVTVDNRYAFVGLMADDQVSVIDMDACTEVKRIDGFFGPHGITTWPCPCLAWKGERCVEAGMKPRVYIGNLHSHEVGIVDGESLELISRIRVGNADQLSKLNPDQGLGEVNAVANPTLVPNGKYVYAADDDSGTLSIIETEGNTVVKTLVLGEGAWRAYSSPDAKYMVVPCNGDETVRVIDTEKMSEVAQFPAGGSMTGANFVQGGKKCYVVSTLGDGQGGVLWVYDLESMTAKGRIAFGPNTVIETACTHPDWKRIYLACSNRNSVYVINGEDDSVKEITNVGEYPWGTHSFRGGDNYCH